MTQEFAAKRETLLSYRKLRDKRTRRHPVGERIREIVDEDSFFEVNAGAVTRDPLHFPGYEQKLTENRLYSGANDACMLGTATVAGREIVIAELSKNFLMGSMGTIAGDKLAKAFELADAKKCPLVILSASGGARMQEGMFSLMQMAKTSAAARRFSDHGGLYISVLTHPTTGGVSASYANLGDIILAEPGALIGFAGPRVIEQTIGEELPEGFQRAEFQQEHGFVDRIVPRENLREEIGRIVRLHAGRLCPDNNGIVCSEDVNKAYREEAGGNRQMEEKDSPEEIQIRAEFDAELKPPHRSLTAYERVQLSRDKSRPKIVDYIDAIFDNFMELRGDRIGREDPAILGGIAEIDGMPVTVIGHRKGKTLDENLRCNFGMPGPEGYRKAARLMRQAEKFGRPIITWIDTPGAYPGKEAEENGQSVAIAENLALMSSLKVPILAIVTGEGNSGGALAIGVGDEIWMLENAVYSVLSPEGFASILWKDAKRSAEACEVMKMTAADLRKDGIIDRVIPEPAGGIQTDFAPVCQMLKSQITEKLQELQKMDPDELTEKRYRKYRNII